MECLNCNKEILLNAKFCPECGTKISSNVTTDKNNDFEVESKEIRQLIETLDQIKDIKVGTVTNTKNISVNTFNGDLVPKKKKTIYFLLISFCLIALPGLHRLYMRSYRSGMLMLGCPFITSIAKSNGIFTDYKGYFFSYILAVYLVQFIDLFKFNSLFDELKEEFDPVYRMKAMEKRAVQDAIDAENRKIAKEADNLKSKSDIEEIKRMFAKSSGNSGKGEKVATAACHKCHLIKPRTEMKRVTKKRRSGSSIGYGFKSKNVSVRAYTSNTQVWVCDKCRSWW